MSIAKKTGLLVGAITALATLASTAEGGEGGEGGRGRRVYLPYPYSYYAEPPRVRVYQPPPVVVYDQPAYPAYPVYPGYQSPEPGVNLNINVPLR